VLQTVVDSNIFVRSEDGPNEWAKTCRLNETTIK